VFLHASSRESAHIFFYFWQKSFRLFRFWETFFKLLFVKGVVALLARARLKGFL